MAKPTQKNPRVLIFDIESSPNIGYTWQKYEQNVIEFYKEWELLAFAYKYLDEKKITCYTRLSFKDATEKSLVKQLWDVLNTADVVITHNGVSFDNRKSNAKFVEHGLPPISPSQQIDTKQVAKRYFNFNSNKLDDLGKLLGVGRKVKHSGFQLWLDCMAGDKKAFAEMAHYNKQDVALLERVYLKLRPWIVNHANLAQIAGRPKACPKCLSKKLKSHGIRYTKTAQYRRYICLTCSGICKGEKVEGVKKPKFVAL